MRLCFWNCRGFGRTTAERYLKGVIRQCLPEIVCLAETKVAGLLGRILSLGFADMYEVTPRGFSGGTVVAWKKGVVVSVQQARAHFVNLLITSNPPDCNWLLSFVYGPTRWNEKSLFWYELPLSGANHGGPWLCLGYFNTIINQSDK